VTTPRVPDADPTPETTATFWALARGFLDRDGVTRSTMMGLPCLRRDGAFFAASDRTTGDLLVKLPEARVTALVATGQAVPFAPAGRRFRQWAAIPARYAESWPALLEEAHRYAGDW
jgi:hypothetical protein